MAYKGKEKVMEKTINRLWNLIDQTDYPDIKDLAAEILDSLIVNNSNTIMFVGNGAYHHFENIERMNLTDEVKVTYVNHAISSLHFTIENVNWFVRALYNVYLVRKYIHESKDKESQKHITENRC